MDPYNEDNEPETIGMIGDTFPFDSEEAKEEWQEAMERALSWMRSDKDDDYGNYGTSPPTLSWRDLVPLAVLLGIGFVLLFLVQLIRDWLGPTEIWRTFLQTNAGQVAGTVAVALLGWALYLFRLFARMWYGAVEFTVAVLAAWLAIGQVIAEGLAAWIAVASSAYIVVRGLDNFSRGRRVKKARERAKSTESHPA